MSMEHSHNKNGLLVLLRHGKSLWNIQRIFTGWIDCDIAPEGIDEAHKAARKLKDYHFTGAYTSVLQRAIKTLDIILKDLNQSSVPVIKNEALNERHYGDLQGRKKDEVKAEVGEEQFNLWRRSYDNAPPNGESLKDTAQRTVPYFQQSILPKLKEGETILVSAHGNSLRSIVMELENIPAKEISNLNIPTGVPYLYEFDGTGKVISKKILTS